MNAKFEKWFEDNWPVTAHRCAKNPNGDPWSTIRNCADESWKASRVGAIQSLEVTPELVELACEAYDNDSLAGEEYSNTPGMQAALNAFLSALKEQAK